MERLVDVIKTTPKQTFANYLVWRLVLLSAEFLNDNLRQRFYEFEATKNGVHKMNPRSVKCAVKTTELCVKSYFYFIFRILKL